MNRNRIFEKSEEISNKRFIYQCITSTGLSTASITFLAVEEIDKAKQSPSFEREYNLKYLGGIGNVFHTKDIEEAIEKGRKYNADTFSIVNNRWFPKSMGIDPAWGSSAFGIVVTQFIDEFARFCMPKNIKDQTTMKCYPQYGH